MTQRNVSLHSFVMGKIRFSLFLSVSFLFTLFFSFSFLLIFSVKKKERENTYSEFDLDSVGEHKGGVSLVDTFDVAHKKFHTQMLKFCGEAHVLAREVNASLLSGKKGRI